VAKKVKSERIKAIEKKVELFIFWGATGLWSLLFLILITVYFRTGVTQAEILSTIRYQAVCLVVAICNCPLMSLNFWVRTLVFGGGVFLLEVGV
jgi:FtsH-binding integral membrane protein